MTALFAVLLLLPAEDPVPIRREVVPAERISAEARGSLVKMPRSDFEARVGQATAAQAARRNRPQLLSLSAAARFDGRCLIGDAKWSIRHTGSQAGLLSVEPLSVAVRSAKWADAGPAVAGELDSSADAPGMELLVEKPGERQLLLEWSANGRVTPGGVRFDLRWPACPIATLELDLPTNAEPLVPAEYGIVTGPRAGPNAGRRLWSVSSGGTTNLPIVIRANSATSAPFIVARQRTRIDAGPVMAEINYEISVEVRGRTSELVLEHHRGLRVISIHADKLQKYVPAADGTHLTLNWSEPIEAATISMRGISAVPAKEPWICPGVRVVDAAAGGETMTISLPPELTLADWRAGAFQLTDAKTDADARQTLTLQSAWWQSVAGRPSFRLQRFFGDVDAAEQLNWSVDADRQTLTAEITLRPHRAALARWRFAIPAAWAVDRVESVETGLTWNSSTAGGVPAVVVEFDRPLAASRSVNLSVALHGSRPGYSADLPFPSLAPLRTRMHTTTLAIRVGRQVVAQASVGSSVCRVGNVMGPSPEPSADAAYEFVGAPVEGILHLRPRPLLLETKAQTTVRIDRDRTTFLDRWEIATDGIPFQSLLFWSKDGGADAAEWRAMGAVAVREVQQLGSWSQIAGMIGNAPVSCVSAAAAATPGSFVRLVFDKPVVASAVIERRETGTAADRADLPRWTIVGDRSHFRSVAVDDPYLLAAVEVNGGQRIEPAAMREFNLRPGDRLSLARSGTHDHRPRIQDARITIDSIEGRLRCRYRATVFSTNDGRLLTKLPADAHLIEMRLADRAVQPAGEPLVVLVPSIPNGIPLEIRYDLPGPNRSPLSRITVPPPQFLDVVQLTEPRYEWNLSGQLIPVAAPMSEQSETIWVARPAGLFVAGIAVAILGVGLLMLPPTRWVHWAALLLIALSALALWQLPAALRPLAFGPVAASAVALFARRASRRAATASLLLLIALPINAAAPEPPTVWLTPGLGGRPDVAWVPAELLDRLDAIARRVGPSVSAAITAASYDVSIDGSIARVTATWDAYAFVSGANLELPLGNASLNELRIDGAEAFPRADGQRLSVMLSKTGRQAIEAHFAVPLASVGNERVVKFNNPEVWSTRLAVQLPSGATAIQLPAARGMVTIQGQRVAADLGHATVVEIRWRGADAPPLATSRWQEGWLWDLTVPSAKLIGVVKGILEPGASRHVAITMPSDVEPLAVRTANPQQLADWSLADRLLRIQLSPDAAGPTVITIECIPRKPLATDAPLPYPRIPGAESAWAWRAPLGSVTAGRVTGVAPLAGKLFMEEFGTPVRSTEPPPTRAYRRASATAAPSMHVVAALAPTWHSAVEMQWRRGERRSEFSVTAELTAVHAAAALIEWEIPNGVTVTGIAGTGVADWSRWGTRLQIWLDRPRAKCSLTMYGFAARPSEQARMDVPQVRMLDARVDLTLRVNSRPGWDLVPVTAQNLAAMPGQAAGGAWTFHGVRPSYRLVLQSRPAAEATEFRSATTVTQDRSQWLSTTIITAKARRGEVRTVGFRLKAAMSDRVTVDATDAIVNEQPAEFGMRTWRVDLPPGVGESYRFQVTVRSAGALPRWNVPLAIIDTGALRPALLVQTIRLGPGVAVRDSSNLAQAADAWNVAGADARLTVETIKTP